MSIGERVHQLLKERGKKQKDLSDYLGTRASTVNGWKEGNKTPSTEMLVPLSEFFDVSLEYLITGEEKNATMQISNNELSEDESDLLVYFRQLTRKNQRAILVQMENMLDDSAVVADDSKESEPKKSLA